MWGMRRGPGTDVVQAIHEVGPRLFNLHMKDLTSFDSKESQVAVGDGIMPVRGIFEALIATKYNGFVDLEYEVHPDDPLPGGDQQLCLHAWRSGGHGVREPELKHRGREDWSCVLFVCEAARRAKNKAGRRLRLPAFVFHPVATI